MRMCFSWIAFDFPTITRMFSVWSIRSTNVLEASSCKLLKAFFVIRNFVPGGECLMMRALTILIIGSLASKFFVLRCAFFISRDAIVFHENFGAFRFVFVADSCAVPRRMISVCLVRGIADVMWYERAENAL